MSRRKESRKFPLHLCTQKFADRKVTGSATNRSISLCRSGNGQSVISIRPIKRVPDHKQSISSLLVMMFFCLFCLLQVTSSYLRYASASQKKIPQISFLSRRYNDNSDRRRGVFNVVCPAPDAALSRATDGRGNVQSITFYFANMIFCATANKTELSMVGKYWGNSMTRNKVYEVRQSIRCSRD